MVVMRRASEADFTFTASGYSEELRVLRFSGSEAISQPFRYNIKLAALDSGIVFEDLVNSPACLTIYGEAGERYVNGTIVRFLQAGVGNRYTVYHAELIPVIYLLSMTSKSRIFQEMNVQEIIEQVLGDASIPSDYYRFALQETHETREYCVQYRESDFNFISRLMEEEGIFYFFEHEVDKHVMVMADGSNIHVPIESPDTVIYNEPTGSVPEEEHIYEYRFSEQIKPGAFVLRDFNFERPTLNLEVESRSGMDDEALEIYDYPGEYFDTGPGDTIVRMRKEAARANRQTGFGNSVCRRFIPGYRFTMDQHPRSDFNQEYLITRLTSSGSQPLGEDSGGGGFEYFNEFECTPFSVTYRPLRKTLKPVVEGVQTAIVVGPSGEEIYTDEHGRVKVQFHWDREGQMNENSSCWVRVSQGWAGASWGAMFIPRIGHEVIVDFLEGNPDRPIITGRVYNGDNTPPYALPDDKTKSTVKSDSSLGGGGSNEIRFEDSKGNEEVFIHAQKDMNENIENNMSTSVGNDKSTSVGHDQTISVKNDRTKTVENNQSETVGNDKTIDVTNNHTETIGNNKELNVGNDHSEVIGNNMTIDIGVDLTETVGGNYAELVDGNMDLQVSTDQFETITGNREISVASNITERADGDSAYSAGGSIAIGAGTTITIEATTTLEGIGGTETKFSAPKVLIDGMAQIQISCGGSVIQMSPASITLSSGSGQIILDPSGATIVGAMVKIN